MAGGFICCFLMRHGEYGDVLVNFSSCQGKNKIEAASAKASAKPKGETEGETKKGAR